jgi:hypothetical protein
MEFLLRSFEGSSEQLYDYLKSKTHEVASEAEKEIKINSHS